MGPRPSKKYSIERLDNDGPYSKTNCAWALGEQQANNTRTNVYVMHEGRRYTLAQLARHLGLNYNTLRQRVLKQRRG